jgi:hypothetical protein
MKFNTTPFISLYLSTTTKSQKENKLVKLAQTLYNYIYFEWEKTIKRNTLFKTNIQPKHRNFPQWARQKLPLIWLSCLQKSSNVLSILIWSHISVLVNVCIISTAEQEHLLNYFCESPWHYMSTNAVIILAGSYCTVNPGWLQKAATQQKSARQCDVSTFS